MILQFLTFYLNGNNASLFLRCSNIKNCKRLEYFIYYKNEFQFEKVKLNRVDLASDNTNHQTKDSYHSFSKNVSQHYANSRFMD